jgi:hypothetical protein
VPKKRIAEPPRAGSKAFQTEIHDALMQAAVGPNYKAKFESRLVEAKDMLRKQQALV